jgi:hypothetical protein
MVMRHPGRIGRIVLAAGLLAGPALPAFSQAVLPRYLLSVAVGGLFPTGAFNEHVGQEGYGCMASFARRLWHSPLLAGCEFDFSEYGHSRRYEYLEGIPDVGVPVNTTNSLGQLLLLLRLQPRSGRLTTFVEALAGCSYFSTETTIGNSGVDDEPMASETNFDDATWTAGLGAGLSFQIWKQSIPEYSHRGTFLELKVRYMAGGKAEYLKKGSIVVVGNEYTLTPERSATSFLTVQAGITWFF